MSDEVSIVAAAGPACDRLRCGDDALGDPAAPRPYRVVSKPVSRIRPPGRAGPNSTAPDAQPGKTTGAAARPARAEQGAMTRYERPPETVQFSRLLGIEHLLCPPCRRRPDDGAPLGRRSPRTVRSGQMSRSVGRITIDASSQVPANSAHLIGPDRRVRTRQDHTNLL